MGDDRMIASFFRFMKGKDAAPYSLFPIDKSGALEDFIHNEYWRRAWITQEIILARDVYFVAAGEAVNSSVLDSGARGIIERCIQGRQWRPDDRNILPVKSRTLLESLWHFRGKECANPQDAVYSLLSICHDGHSLTVDYSVSMVQLALNVLKIYQQDLCLCRAKIVLQALTIDFAITDRDSSFISDADRPFAEIHLPKLPVDTRYCDRCNGNIRLAHLRQSYPISQMYVYCLGCQHSIWPALGKAQNNSFGVISRSHHISRFGHIVFAQVSHSASQNGRDEMNGTFFKFCLRK
ncbi:uncharacterized protein K460DRAFT_433433 [Cucurbitaria berberidis CBS 394.84]|uniref:Heterokaryon incompatibility domain-containing protein n=1 Tax=Cucurbitaria berberidis CBS 394.84 TaxID=1168544 RepID=A0A9P4L6V3_9PLEO|nr:uncharacterized protein K460DRAFT_433433 [Cucurbitaria berberidis CBS 394.84]KAF1843712.1 hypothetical protein K460DRAFT_433433 [Cucurbitaria berberidis CBS 394.84]